MSESTGNTTSNVIPPEEEEIFKEFQAYVRSIYLAASEGAIQSLNDATTELRDQVKQLDETVTQSREGYREMFLPAVERFDSSASAALTKLAAKQDDIARLHWERTAELVKLQAQEHSSQLQQQAEQFEASMHKRLQKLAIILIGVMLALAVLIPVVVNLAYRPK